MLFYGYNGALTAYPFEIDIDILKVEMNTDQTEDNILLELHNAVKALQSYPERHPPLKVKLMKSYSLLVDSLATRESISWLIDKRGIFMEDDVER
jgi:hypothetical protein